MDYFYLNFYFCSGEISRVNSSHSDRNPRDLESKNVPQVGRDFAAMNNRNVLVLNMTSRDEALLTTDAVVFFACKFLLK